jgi:hypothetical protein
MKTKDEITKLAHEAGLHLATDVHWIPIIGLEYAERLIALVAAAEREECAKLCETLEAVCYDTAGYTDCAAAIRARGNRT